MKKLLSLGCITLSIMMFTGCENQDMTNNNDTVDPIPDYSAYATPTTAQLEGSWDFVSSYLFEADFAKGVLLDSFSETSTENIQALPSFTDSLLYLDGLDFEYTLSAGGNLSFYLYPYEEKNGNGTPKDKAYYKLYLASDTLLFLEIQESYDSVGVLIEYEVSERRFLKSDYAGDPASW